MLFGIHYLSKITKNRIKLKYIYLVKGLFYMFAMKEASVISKNF